MTIRDRKRNENCLRSKCDMDKFYNKYNKLLRIHNQACEETLHRNRTIGHDKQYEYSRCMHKVKGCRTLKRYLKCAHEHCNLKRLKSQKRI